MNIEDARTYCLSKQNATEDFPFDETTLAFRVENRIFAITDLETAVEYNDVPEVVTEPTETVAETVETAETTAATEAAA